ncbi:hypothetical protein CC85DRAFT_314525 [Cutaneotrichosporon oleaginosum]|uniref:Extracellular membrane protein CFEM domain-containing protein n=1 Tax=Cutaneotrichosporon oleaginosum TaxID=879819 RepID=A0A0J0XZ47_9TREE|nr:uncharacterized protein CC85DRAFT_314525 [Cutaneotrichosporon oleaginosum]KLT46327.1 hypothetical protein CC85DRAFT_314525 [Cutaneotrichosporon oleaginosum]TXT15301.1 hypothetical protein COLE_01494 [Cutaneotrichosporon oleaginosum]
MLPIRILLTLLASVALTSAAPHHLAGRQDEADPSATPDVIVEPPPEVTDTATPTVAQTTNDIVIPTSTTTSDEATMTDGQELPFANCRSECSGAFDDFSRNCDGSNPSNCKTVCEMWLEGFKQCEACMQTKGAASDPGQAKITEWAPFAANCPPVGGGGLDAYNFGDCGDTCKPPLQSIITACEVATECAKSCDQKENLMKCNDCVSAPSSTADDKAKALVKEAVDGLNGRCGGAPAGCEEACKAFPDLKAACDNPNNEYSTDCLGTCWSEWDTYAPCEQCYIKNGSVPADVAKTFEAATFWCAPGGCYVACDEATTQLSEHCTAGEEACKKNVCESGARNALQQCRSCMSNAPVDDKAWRDDIILPPISTVDDYCSGKIAWPTDQCQSICSPILDLDYNSCKDADINKCAAMCADESLGALEQCMQCATDSTVEDLFNKMRGWCKEDPGPTPIVVVVNPTVTVTVPNRPPPTGIAPESRPTPTGKTGISVNTSRPVATTRRPSGSARATSQSSASELSFSFGGMGFGAALGLIMGILVVVV